MINDTDYPMTLDGDSLDDTLNFTSSNLDSPPDSMVRNVTTGNGVGGGPPLATRGSPSQQQTDPLTMIMSLGWVALAAYCFCKRRQPPGREHWRGAEIRERYLRMQAQQRARELRESQSPQQRHELVQHNLRTKRVIAKDQEGNWTLGSVSREKKARAGESSQTTQPSPFRTEFEYDDDDDEEHACVICLDSFQVGDLVSWSRHSMDCHHVYHAECIQPWLEGKRQDECPSCRNPIILETPPHHLVEEGDVEGGLAKSNSLDDEIDEPSDREEDSFFVIVHGMISRAARRASYTLIGNKDSIDSLEDLDTLSLPSPLRRVMSHEPLRSSLTNGHESSSTISFPLHTADRRGDPLTPSPPPSPIHRQSLEDDVDIEANFPELLAPISFRKVQSDIGGSSPARFLHPRYPLPRGSNMSPGGSIGNGRESDDDDVQDPPPLHRRSGKSILVLLGDGDGQDVDDDIRRLATLSSVGSASSSDDEEDTNATAAPDCENHDALEEGTVPTQEATTSSAAPAARRSSRSAPMEL